MPFDIPTVFVCRKHSKIPHSIYLKTGSSSEHVMSILFLSGYDMCPFCFCARTVDNNNKNKKDTSAARSRISLKRRSLKAASDIDL